jgi:hypothetical protein
LFLGGKSGATDLRAVARAAVVESVEVFYNTQRRHPSSRGCAAAG